MGDDTDGHDVHSVVFTWVDADKANKKAEEEGEVKVELLLALAQGINSDAIGDYLESHDSNDSRVKIFHARKTGANTYAEEVKLGPGTYHFVFRLAVAGESSIVLSNLHLKTVLASGRSVNYINCGQAHIEHKAKPSGHGTDVDEGTPLMREDASSKKKGKFALSPCCQIL